MAISQKLSISNPLVGKVKMDLRNIKFLNFFCKQTAENVDKIFENRKMYISQTYFGLIICEAEMNSF